MKDVNRSLVVALATVILRDLVKRCSDTDGGAGPDEPKQRWAMAGARIDHQFQNPFVDAAALLTDLGLLSDAKNYNHLLVSAADLEDHFASADGAARLEDFAASEAHVSRLVLSYAEFANWYWVPAFPMGPEPFDTEIRETPALQALIAAGFLKSAEGIYGWSNRFGALVTRHDLGKYGWPEDLSASQCAVRVDQMQYAAPLTGRRITEQSVGVSRLRSPGLRISS